MGENLTPPPTRKAQWIFHVGLPKTGTTFLQKRWFPRLAGFDYFSTEPPYRWPGQLSWLYQLNTEGFRRGCVPAARGKHTGAEALAQVAEKNYALWIAQGKSFLAQLERPAIFSSEGLAGHSLAVNKLHARLIKDIFGQAKIIFVFRRQAEWLHSLWRQLVLVEDRFSRYLGPSQLIETSNGGAALIDMDWCAFVETYDTLFGEENVLALPYEQMQADPRAFVGEIAQFIGSSLDDDVDFGSRENVFEGEMKYVGWNIDDWLNSETGYRIRRTLRRAGLFARVERSRFAGWLLREIAPAPFGADLKSRIMGEYAGNNRALGKRLGKDLAAYGYY
jgi:hypothetical protein